MAERRMFAKTIIDSDLFLDMPLSTQALYFHLAMRADDDGFVNNPKKIRRMIGATDDDLKILIAKSFLIPFDSGIVVIRHWKIHNYIRKDTYNKTPYTNEMQSLSTKKNGEYELRDELVTNPSRTHDEPVSNPLTQDRLGKVSIGKDNIDSASSDEESPAPEPDKPKKRFVKPTLAEVQAYCRERNNNVDPESFIAYYESNGWKVGKNPMKNWKSAIVTWERNGFSNSKTSNSRPQTPMDDPDAYVFDWEQIRREHG